MRTICLDRAIDPVKTVSAGAESSDLQAATFRPPRLTPPAPKSKGD